MTSYSDALWLSLREILLLVTTIKIDFFDRFLDLQTQDLKIAPSNDSDDQQSGSELLKKSIEQTLPKEPEVKVPKETPEDAAVSKEATKDMHLEKRKFTG